MRLAIATPVVTNVAGAELTWERTASIEDIGRVAETADRLGYHHLTCSEHIGIPSTEAGRRGSRYWDPLATFGYVAARTQQIRLATMTLVLGYHHPLAIVKRYGTLDHVSGGRVILGVGVGTLKEEFDLLGAPFDDRGARADDALKALRAALPSNEPAYDGEYYSFGGLIVDPCALQPAHADLDRRPHPSIVATRVDACRRLVSVQRVDRHRRRVAQSARAAVRIRGRLAGRSTARPGGASRSRLRKHCAPSARPAPPCCRPGSSIIRSSTTSSRSMR